MRPNSVTEIRPGPWPSPRTACTRPVGPDWNFLDSTTRAMIATSSPTFSVSKSDMPVPEM